LTGLLTKILKQRLYKTGAVAIETAVHVDVWSIDCGQDQVGVVNSVKSSCEDCGVCSGQKGQDYQRVQRQVSAQRNITDVLEQIDHIINPYY